MKKYIYVTKPFLPPLSEFIPYLEKIWENGVLTNGGPMHKELEERLCNYLGVKYISLFNNGTIALLTALQTFNLKGEIVTTPYSFVATAHSILWNKLTPVFVDIDYGTLNIDVNKIESAITEKTSAILAVHCYGHPCEVEKIEKIANKYNLKVIYDAAHAFDVKKRDKSILNYGDASVLSFHATKIFNTFEGGAIITNNLETKQRIDSLKNFGIKDETTITDVGINGKMSEINAAFGILQLEYISRVKEKRGKVASKYKEELKGIDGIKIFGEEKDIIYNNSYFPVLIEKKNKISRDDIYNNLKSCGVFSRKYFYPLLSNLPMYEKLESASSINLPVANEISEKILCLPIYPDLEMADVEDIAKVIKNALQ